MRSITRLAAAVGASLFVTFSGNAALAQETPPMMKVDFIAIASGFIEGDSPRESSLCVMLPDEASTVTVTRRAFVPEAGTDRPLTMTIRPFVSTAFPLAENVSIRDTLSLTLPQLGGETCFSFLNALAPREVKAAQPYKHYAQIMTIEVR